MNKKTQKKFIDFIITQKCTYRCPYCSQSKQESAHLNNATDEVIESFFNFLDTLEKDYEITITGGEALLHPRFFEIINKIKSKNFKINLISNFSFDIELYKKIFNILENTLLKFDLSFHLEEIKDFEFTIKKLEEFLTLKPKLTKTTILIPIYNIDKIKEQKISELVKIAQKYKIEHDFQNIRVLNKYIDKNVKPNKTFSRLCYAGCLSAVIYENGECYKCYSSRFLKINYLGNIKDKNFKLNDKPQPCLQQTCTCPKPNLYNQISTQKKLRKALFYSTINLLYFPMMIIKNKQIVTQKLKQYLKLRKT